jgi:hypothetical protein
MSEFKEESELVRYCGSCISRYTFIMDKLALMRMSSSSLMHAASSGPSCFINLGAMPPFFFSEVLFFLCR